MLPKRQRGTRDRNGIPEIHAVEETLDAGLLQNQTSRRDVGRSKLKASIPKSRQMMTLWPVIPERGAPWVAPQEEAKKRVICVNLGKSPLVACSARGLC